MVSWKCHIKASRHAGSMPLITYFLNSDNVSGRSPTAPLKMRKFATNIIIVKKIGTVKPTVLVII